MAPVCRPSPGFPWLAVLAAVGRALAEYAALFVSILVLPVVGSVQVTRSLMRMRALPTAKPQLPAKEMSCKRLSFRVNFLGMTAIFEVT